ncbi:MAG: hypothetical protein NXI30_04420 [bacterium]|nr:hypothetical protein [bacterium]
MTDWIQWRDEEAIEEWLHLYWWELDIFRFAIKPPEGLRFTGDAHVERQRTIRNASKDHSGPAPADLVFELPCVDEDDRVRAVVWLIVELKNRKIEASDLAQVARYMAGLREEKRSKETCYDEVVCGALIGTGVTWAAVDAVRLAPAVTLGSIDVQGSDLDFEIWNERFDVVVPGHDGMKSDSSLGVPLRVVNEGA